MAFISAWEAVTPELRHTDTAASCSVQGHDVYQTATAVICPAVSPARQGIAGQLLLYMRCKAIEHTPTLGTG